jgi:spore photoproduct lyase
VDLYLGCTLGCSYCIMKSYLNFEPITVYADPAPPIAKIRELAKRNPDRMVRVGSGETGDSLLLDPLFGLTAEFIRGLSDLQNVYFESKTKTNFVDHLLDIPEKGNAVISFSLNAESFSQAEEGCSATIGERLAAAEKAAAAGYFLAFHFDPVVRFPGWEEAYGGVIDKLSRFDSERIVWISLGTFRYTPALKDRMQDRFFLYDEFVPCRDGKYRYLQKIRSGMYSCLTRKIKEVLDAPVYYCMESADIWKKTRGAGPLRLPRIRDIFNPIRQEE